MKTLFTMALFLGLAAGSASLTSCNTLYGMGEDLTHFGERIANSGTARGITQDLDTFGDDPDGRPLYRDY